MRLAQENIEVCWMWPWVNRILRDNASLCTLSYTSATVGHQCACVYLVQCVLLHCVLMLYTSVSSFDIMNNRDHIAHQSSLRRTHLLLLLNRCTRSLLQHLTLSHLLIREPTRNILHPDTALIHDSDDKPT